MPLDDLVRVIEILKSRILEHRSTLSAYEARTRNSLVDPLLTALGWDVSNPSLVTVEYNVGGGRADYALLSSDGKPRVFIEAKRLGESLNSHRSQIVTYAVELGTPYSVLTDGDRWEVYDTFKQVPMDQKRIMDVSIGQNESAKASLKLLMLWRANIASGNPVSAGEPIFDSKPATSLESEQIVPTPSSTPSSKDWTSLEKFQITPNTQTPPAVRFLNGEEQEVSSWRWVIIQVAEWLVRQGILSEYNCPVFTVRGPSQGYALVNTKPFHPNESNMNGSHQLSNGLYVAAGAGDSKEILGRAKHLLTTLGQEPSQVWLKMG